MADELTTANELYLDAAIRHQLGLRRYSSGLANKVSGILESADKELVMKLRERLARFTPGDTDFTSERWKQLLADIKDARSSVLADVRQAMSVDLNALGKMEHDREISILQSAIPIDIAFATVAADQLRAIVSSRPFQGKLLKDWAMGLEASDRARVIQAIQLGMSQGETIDDIVRRVVGTRANKYADGVLSITRRDAQTIVRTAVSHISNTARNYVWDANSDIITAKIWVSVLDGRTTLICMSRDGHGTPVGNNQLPPGVIPLYPPGAVPPAHMNCRSVLVAYINGIGLVGTRPTVSDTRTRGAREIDFRAMARSSGKPIQEVRQLWAAKHIGEVASSTTYPEFFARQTAAFQDEVLGPTKGLLFRQGGLQISQFVDRAGNELTLEQLADTVPEAFKSAGLDLHSYQ